MTCGGSTSTRQRLHSCTGQVDIESTYCNTHPCSYYGAWSNWSPCSASCGLGSMNRLRYCHGGRVGDGLCLTGEVTTDETVQCDMGDCCDFDWSGWTGCCRDQNNQNVKLRFRGACAGDEMDQLAKPCDNNIGTVPESCLVVIQNSQSMGIIQGSTFNSVSVINPDEFINFQDQTLTGRTLGHADNLEFHHSLDTNTVHSTMQGQYSEITVTESNGISRTIQGTISGNGQFWALDANGLENMQLNEGLFVGREWRPYTNSQNLSSGSVLSTGQAQFSEITMTDMNGSLRTIRGTLDGNGQFRADAGNGWENMQFTEGFFVDLEWRPDTNSQSFSSRIFSSTDQAQFSQITVTDFNGIFTTISGTVDGNGQFRAGAGNGWENAQFKEGFFIDGFWTMN